MIIFPPKRKGPSAAEGSSDERGLVRVRSSLSLLWSGAPNFTRRPHRESEKSGEAQRREGIPVAPGPTVDERDTRWRFTRH